MHLADFSYTERLLQNSTFFVLFLVHLGLQTQFKDIRRRVKNVKTAVFGLTMMSFLGWIIMDIMTMYLKYLEWRDPTRNCMPRRQSQYTQSHYDMTRGMKYYFNVVWTLQSSALFLLLVFIRKSSLQDSTHAPGPGQHGPSCARSLPRSVIRRPLLPIVAAA